jgi:succinate dehydrogenase/fumarate reductase flavoprotein subunit
VSIEATYDVIVVGGGGSGLAAAIEARALGRDVVLIEKNPELGGSTAWSIGSVTASQTPHQARKGIVDNPADHWRDMAGFNGDLDARDNAGLRRVLAYEMPETFRWLLKQGVRFYGPMPEPPHSKPRMHNVLPNSRAFITHLAKAARRADVTILCGVRANALVVERGRVVAIDCDTAAGPRRLRARGGVVLATGDFTSDPELKAQFMGPQQAKIDGVNVNATGDGQKLALPLGARIINGDLALGPELRFVPPPGRNILLILPPWRVLANVMAWSLERMPSALLRPFVMSFVTTALAPSPDLFAAGAILINGQGERFTDELDQPAYALPDQPGKLAYIVLDQRMAALFSGWPHFISTAPGVAYAYVDDYRRNRADIFTTSPTLDALAAKLAMPAALAATVRAHNAGAGNRPLLGEGPYVALGPVRAVFVHAEGGLAVDHEHRVLGANDTPIMGLYAAGSTGQGGLLLKGHGHHLGWAFASGRRAGRNAARESSAVIAGLDPAIHDAARQS